jgi:anti-anti-sigma factor
MTAREGRRNGAVLKVTSERIGATVVLDLAEGLTVESDTHRLGRLVRWVNGTGDGSVVLDLERVERMDCSGIGLLLRLRGRLQRQGRILALANVERRQERLLELAGLLTVFQVFCSRQAALAWCGAMAPAPAVRAAPARRLGAGCGWKPPTRVWRELSCGTW